MKINSITPIVITVPLKQDIKMGGMIFKNSENLLIQIRTEDGSIGWGEASSVPDLTGETVAGMEAAINYLTPSLIGRDPSFFIENMNIMDRMLYGNGSVKAAFEIACCDVVGKVQGKPMSELLGGVKRNQIPVLWLLAAGNLKSDSEEAKIKFGEGFRSFKLKVGGNPLDEDILRVKKIREIIGKTSQLSVDANQAWSCVEGKNFVKQTSEFLDFVEQPVMGTDLESMGKIVRASDALIGADEGIHSIGDIVVHKEQGAAAGGSLKMIKLGGVFKALAAAELSEQLGMKVNLSGAICETSISSAAVVHLAASIPQIDWGLSVTNQYANSDIVQNPIKIINGKINVPHGNGLGVEVDEIAISKLKK